MRDTRCSIRRAVLAWFRREARDLPWRRRRDPYAVWVSEIMLQQTRVDQCVPYFERFIEALPTVRQLAAAQEDRVLKLWEGLGYYGRARNLHKAAKLIVDRYAGRFPQTAEEWQRLPGVGRYTAGAIASIAFGERAAVLDGNVKRVLSRLFDVEDCIDEPHMLARLWALADTLVQGKSPGDYNQAVMELGARVCTPKRPCCAECPVRKDCESCAKGVQAQRPVRRPRQSPPHYELVVAVIGKKGRYLMGKRPSGGLLGGLWEFPCGKVAPGESHHEALCRSAKEDLGITVKVDGLVAVVDHAYSHFKVTLNVYRCAHVAGKPRRNAHTALKWVPRTQFDRYALSKASHKFLELL